jgi:hypothetical protein
MATHLHTDPQAERGISTSLFLQIATTPECLPAHTFRNRVDVMIVRNPARGYDHFRHEQARGIRGDADTGTKGSSCDLYCVGE